VFVPPSIHSKESLPFSPYKISLPFLPLRTSLPLPANKVSLSLVPIIFSDKSSPYII